MSDFRERLKQDLKVEAPFTKEVAKRIEFYKPIRKKRVVKPTFVLGIVTVVAAIFIFLMQASNNPSYLMNANEVPTSVPQLIEQMKKNEVNLPFLLKMEEDQQLITDADIMMNGELIYFSSHNVIVEEVKHYKRGDYVLIEHSGEKYVRQLVGLGEETYGIDGGNVFINEKRLLLPGFVYAQNDNTVPYHEFTRYFNLMPIRVEYREMDMTISEDEYLVQSITTPQHPVEKIQKEQVIGKVVALEKVEPTFLLTGEDKKLFESFKTDKDVQKLVGVDPSIIIRMFLTTIMEEDAETLYALMPSYVKLHNLTVKQFEKEFFIDEINMDREREFSHYAAMYNGLENSRVEYSNGKATIYFKNNKGIEGSTFQLYKNAQGFWEVQFN